MKPINEYIKNPNLDIGGCLVTMTGPPGCGKTNSLIQIAIDRFEGGHKVIWRGTAQAQWAAFEANDIPVKLWLDDSISDLRAWVSKQDSITDIDLEEKIDEIEHFEDPEDLITKASKEHINVVQVPGLMGEKHEKYYFRKRWIDILKALVNRRDVANPFSFFTDEGGDIWPCQQQLRKPFYKLVAEDTPPLLAQLRKQMVFMYIAAHSTHDLHYFVWKIKGNTIGYMSNANVQRDIHTEVDQGKVNRLSRGQVIVPPKDRGTWKLAYEAEDLEWVGKNGKFRVSWEADIPNLLDEEEDEKINPERVKNDAKKKIAKRLYNDYDELGLTQDDLCEIMDLGKGTINSAVNT